MGLRRYSGEAGISEHWGHVIGHPQNEDYSILGIMMGSPPNLGSYQGSAPGIAMEMLSDSDEMLQLHSKSSR